jgi:predicted  nucleic acid-binding Zn-ribbon protein
MKKEKAKVNKKHDQFSTTEVGTLLESIHKEVKTIAGGHVGLDKRMEKLEISVHGNSRRLDMVELRLDVVHDKVTRLDDAVSKVSKDLKETRQELGGKIEALDQRVETMGRELSGKIDRLDERLAGVEARN